MSSGASLTRTARRLRETIMLMSFADIPFFPDWYAAQFGFFFFDDKRFWLHVLNIEKTRNIDRKCQRTCHKVKLNCLVIHTSQLRACHHTSCLTMTKTALYCQVHFRQISCAIVSWQPDTDILIDSCESNPSQNFPCARKAEGSKSLVHTCLSPILFSTTQNYGNMGWCYTYLGQQWPHNYTIGSS